MKVFILPQTSKVQPLKFGNGWGVISSILGLKLIHVNIIPTNYLQVKCRCNRFEHRLAVDFIDARPQTVTLLLKVCVLHRYVLLFIVRSLEDTMKELLFQLGASTIQAESESTTIWTELWDPKYRSGKQKHSLCIFHSGLLLIELA